MAMQQIALLLLLLAAAHGLSVAVSPTPIINTTCAALAHSPNVTVHVDYEFCVRALSADPASSSATDARGLAAAAASLTVANLTSTEHIIADLVHNLGRCLTDYREINGMVRHALDDIRGGRGADASEKLLQVAKANAPAWYDLILIEGDAKRNPIDQENHNADFLSVIASGIAELMLHSHG
ncbi:putative invertase inhibitor [Triticum urartu]|uniref:putative invertase inhibitor n=1 Tax=Triticum urartu TaxID=4572 RepID=UPI0020432254|nr:putative invertase inhibitor [Triticum urartu]